MNNKINNEPYTCRGALVGSVYNLILMFVYNSVSYYMGGIEYFVAYFFMQLVLFVGIEMYRGYSKKIDIVTAVYYTIISLLNYIVASGRAPKIYTLLYLMPIVVYILVMRQASLKLKHISTYIENNSKRLQALQQLNKILIQDVPDIVDIINHDSHVERIDVDLNTLTKYKVFDFEKYLLNLIKEDTETYKAWLDLVNKYYDRYTKYEAEIRSLPDFMSETETELNYNDVHKLEVEMCNNRIIHYEPQIVIYKMYVSPAGQNRYRKSKTFSIQDIRALVQKATVQEQQKDTKQTERNKMTNSLRYDILKRDNFRCTICGRTAADGITLHVDHIKPVAKGGLTEYSNLRTLCNECNSGKSDKYDSTGVN